MCSSTPNYASFSTAVDIPGLWLPTRISDMMCSDTYSEWLTKLVLAMLDSSAVTDEVLLAIKPVCKVKVSPLDRWKNNNSK